MRYLGIVLIMAGTLPGIGVLGYAVLSLYTGLLDDPLSAQGGGSTEELITLGFRVAMWTVPLAAVGIILLAASRSRSRAG